MLIQIVLPFFFLLCTITVLLTIILYSWLNGKASGTLNSYLCSLSVAIVWSICHILEIFTIHTSVAKWILGIRFLAICFIGMAWLIFCLWYSESKFVKKSKNILLLGIIPTICLIGITTHSYLGFWYHPIFLKPQFLFWFCSIVTCLYYGIGMLFFIRYSWKQFSDKKKQILIMSIVSLVLLIANIIQMGINIQVGFDYTPIVFTLMLLFIAFRIFKKKLLNSESLVMGKMMENMKEAILVTDCFNQIIDFNPALKEAFVEYCEEIKIGTPIHIFAERLQGFVENNSESFRIVQAIAVQKPIQTCGPIDFVKPKKKCFIVNICPVFSGRELIGRVLSFNDITLAKNLWDELYTTSNQLSVKNQQLNHYAETVAELAVAKERNRFARDVHDTLGQTMTLLVTLLQIAKMSYRVNPEKSESQLDKALKIAGEGLAEVKRSLLNLPAENDNSLRNTLESLVEDFRMSGMEIELSLGDLERYKDFSYTSVIYRICQEALTNALRHGKASHVWITIEVDDEWLCLAVADDGKGCKDFRKGYGLKGMEERVIHLKGNIIYNHGNTGFGIFVMIPLSIA